MTQLKDIWCSVSGSLDRLHLGLILLDNRYLNNKTITIICVSLFYNKLSSVYYFLCDQVNYVTLYSPILDDIVKYALVNSVVLG